MFPRALRIARIGGVDVRIDPSWIIIALLVVWFFFARFGADGRTTATALTMAGVGALLFFVSVLVHELAHALEARHRDLEVRGITLFLFGGVTEMHLETERPFDEFAVSAVGPYLSLVTAAVFGLAGTALDLVGWAEAAEVAGTLGWLNVLLAVFNLIPGAPLDGGRVLRALIWAVTKDRQRSVRIASYAGQVVAGLLAAWGVWTVINAPEALFDALWLGFIAWFMWQAASAERRHAETASLLDGRTAGSLITVTPPRLEADRSLSLVADQIAGSPGFEVFPVTANGQGSPRIVGALHLPDVMKMDPTDRNFRTAAEVMRPIESIPAIDASESVQTLLRRIDDEPLLKVLDGDGEVAALATRRQVTAALERLHALARERRGARGHLPHRSSDGSEDGRGHTSRPDGSEDGGHHTPAAPTDGSDRP